ncbi:UDP-N-acetylglucosamine pyrophosphorylase [Angomonas deanei]|nr:UDP-N-acetylglucosamine pyrophosphorylase [Angomonas deanei]|eukprot:EPY28893.1 UDP-N-acetylglucosamine pyrophosphorylase [Angomonas deanei]
MTCVVERQELETVLTDANQGHLLDHYERLSDDEKSALSETILKSGFDFKHLNHVLRDSLVLLDQSQPDAQGAKDTIRPPTAGEVVDVAALRRSDPAQLQSLEEKGLLEVVARGEAAVLLLAGGSGSRLGFAPPKGMFVNPHLKGNRSLFQWHCERVLKVERLALAALCKESGVSPASIHSRTVSTSSVSTPQVLNRSQHSSNSPSSHPSTPSNATGVFTPRIQVLIMTSEQNNEDIQKFFIKKKYFGLKSDQVHFFQQQSLPCYDEATGKILMASESTMCVAPGGNGGVYASLAAPIRQTTTFGDKKPSSSSIRSDSTPVTETTGSLLDLLTARGVQQVQIFNVDNVLAKVADPLLYGYTRQCNAAVVVKTSSKVSPEERVGVFARRNDRWGVVEYTEIGGPCDRSQRGWLPAVQLR